MDGLGQFVTKSYAKGKRMNGMDKKPGYKKGTGSATRKPSTAMKKPAAPKKAKTKTEDELWGPLVRIKPMAKKAMGKKAVAKRAEVQRRGMAATRAEAPTRRKIARDAFYRDQDAKMAANKKKWSAANKKGMN